MGYSYIYPPLSNAPSGRVVEPTQEEEFFGSEPISSQSPQSITNEQFQQFTNSVSNSLPFKREGPLPESGASSTNSVIRPPPPPVQQLPPISDDIPVPIVPKGRLRQKKIRQPLLGRVPPAKLIPPRKRTEDDLRKNPLKRLLDQSFFGSDTVQTAVLAPPEMTVDGLEAASSKDHQLIPIYDKQVMTREDERGGKMSLESFQQGNEESEQGPDEKKIVGITERKTTPSVNYGYHPIIDFFDRYRFDAAAA